VKSTGNENSSIEVFYGELCAVIGRVSQADLTLLYLHFRADEIVEQESGDTWIYYIMTIEKAKS